MPTTTLVCKQCNFENEAERVYCHNCGAKLDRSLLPPEATRREDPVVVQERVRKMVSPRRGLGLRNVKYFFLSVALSALLALLIVAGRTPEGVPTLNKDAVLDAPTITDDMEAQEQLPAPHRLTYTEDQVNAFLQSSIRGKQDAAGTAVMKFERVFVHLNDGSCAITTQHSLFGYSFYATTIHTLRVENGALVTDTLGGAFGRLRVSGKLMKGLEGIFAPLWNVLDQDRRLMAKMQSVVFHKKMVEMTTRPAAAGH